MQALVSKCQPELHSLARGVGYTHLGATTGHPHLIHNETWAQDLRAFPFGLINLMIAVLPLLGVLLRAIYNHIIVIIQLLPRGGGQYPTSDRELRVMRMVVCMSTGPQYRPIF